MRPIAIIGLDCADADLVFDQFRGELPHLANLMQQGSYGVLRSCHPPITVPAWSCLTSGYDAGQLGIYGFRNRQDYSYENLAIAFSTAVTRPRLWDVFSQHGRSSIVLGVPQTFPIDHPPQGVLVSSFLTPDKNSAWVFPHHLAAEIDRVAEGDYLIDVRNFRTQEKPAFIDQVYTMTRRRFLVAEHLLATQPWDLFMMVEMGPDRLHHGIWHYADPQHPRFAGDDHPLRWALRDYYRQLDQHIGSLLKHIPSEALVLIVSDHGAQAMQGGIAVNEWLIQQGYLVLHHYPSQPTPPQNLAIDWSRTRAWSEGGYYARVFLNVQGREPQGIVPPHQYEALRDTLIDAMQALSGPAGEPLATRVHRPESLFRECRGVPPDLLCYWGNLAWRSVGSVGHGRLHIMQNDTGPDEANHDWDGIFISRDRLAQAPSPASTMPAGALREFNLLDIGPSVLAAAGLPVSCDSAGRPNLVWQ